MADGPARRYGRQQGHSAMEGVNDAGLQSVLQMIGDHSDERNALAADHAKQAQDLNDKHVKALKGLSQGTQDQ